MSAMKLRSSVDAVLTAALDGLTAEIADKPAARLALLRMTAGQTVGVAEREMRALGSRDRARLTAELALSAALLHLRLSELLPADAAPALVGQDLQALTVPVLTVPVLPARKDLTT